VLLVVTLYVLANVAYLNVLPTTPSPKPGLKGAPVGTAAMQQMFGQGA